MSTPGKLLRIFLRPSTRTPVREVTEAVAVADQGLDGDHAHGGKRQVTLIAREGWAEAMAELGADVSPGGRRANLVVEGVDLGALLGRRLRVGQVEVELAGETRPCQLMDDVTPGLWQALKPRRRGGMFARILVGGTLRVGDAVEVLEPATTAAS
jgi:MOSC domain-containing protein YiiM